MDFFVFVVGTIRVACSLDLNAVRDIIHLDGVAVDDRPVLLEVLRGEAALVNDFHLLHNCALPGFTSTYRIDQKLNHEFP